MWTRVSALRFASTIAEDDVAVTSIILLTLISWMKVPPYIALELIDSSDWHIVAILSPVAIFGAWFSYRMTRLLPQNVFLVVVEVALFLI